MSIVKILPDFRSGGGAQMALDIGLLETVDEVIARQYIWAPPALSIGKFQELETVPGLPFEVVRRPTGGRAVLHGEAFEWSFAVAFPLGVPLGGGATTPNSFFHRHVSMLTSPAAHPKLVACAATGVRRSQREAAGSRLRAPSDGRG